MKITSPLYSVDIRNQALKVKQDLVNNIRLWSREKGQEIRILDSCLVVDCILAFI